MRSKMQQMIELSPTVAPEHAGPRGKAWRLALATPDAPRVETQACLGAWLVFAPTAHPFWSFYVVSAVHLRDVPGQSTPARKHYPEAEYEFQILSMDPDRNERFDPAAPAFKHLEPPDCVKQFGGGVTDEQVAKFVEHAARFICDGHLSPDSDFRAAWERQVIMFVEHHTTGHPQAQA